MKIKGRCIVCGAKLSAPLFSLNDAPAGAYEMPDREGLSMDHGITLPLSRCPDCGLLQLNIEPVGYYRDVRRAVGLSPTMLNLRRADFSLLIDKYGLSGGKWVEIGCGAGDFLKLLSEYPVDFFGTEHDPLNVSAARTALGEAEVTPGEDIGINTHIMEWFPESGEDTIPGAPYDAFLSFNFLEHQPDPVAMLKAAYRSLKPGGVGLITVPSFEYIAKRGRFYELVRDHIANYDLSSLRYLAELCGFNVTEECFLGIGDTLRMVVRKDEPSRASGPRYDTSKRYEELAESFQKGYFEYTARIEEFVKTVTCSGRSIAMWGAGHQGFTVAAATALKDSVRYIIDSSPAKAGRFAPSSHIPIVAPSYFGEDPADVILISAPGYVREIEASVRALYGSVPLADITDLSVR